ncbi:hypothetical protein KEM55_005366 [Ascosphaera atra]|nr:hypothetical protein KEM55_005366 [Ascosphaera atra]
MCGSSRNKSMEIMQLSEVMPEVSVRGGTRGGLKPGGSRVVEVATEEDPLRESRKHVQRRGTRGEYQRESVESGSRRRSALGKEWSERGTNVDADARTARPWARRKEAVVVGVAATAA